MRRRASKTGAFILYRAIHPSRSSPRRSSRPLRRGTASGGSTEAEERRGIRSLMILTSILALRADTGKLAWYYQTTPGESWDFTATQHMILADLEIQSRKRKVLMQAPKNGFFYVLDRTTGELLSAKPYVQISWAKEVDPKTGRP